MQCLVALFAVGTSAANIGDYVYTPNAKLKVTGENLVTNGAFNQGDGTEGWKNENAGALTSNWTVVTNVGPNGENAMQSQGATTDEGTALCNSWELSTGIYAISYWVNSSTSSTSITAGQNNFVSFFANEDGSQTVTRQVSEAQTFAASTWTQIVDTVVVSVEKEYLVLKINNVVDGTQFTNFAVQKVEEVYDTRLAQERIAFIQKLQDDANFNVEAAADYHDELAQIIEAINSQIEEGQLEDQSMAEGMMAGLEEAFVNYLDATTKNLTANSYFRYVEDLEDMPKYNRGQITNGQQIGGFKFYGDNWQHGVYRDASNNIINGPNGKQGLPYLQKAIQAGQNGPGPGSVVLANATIPAGKYFIAADMMNAYQDGKYNPNYTLEAGVKAFVGSDTVDVGTIVGSKYVRLYAVATLKEGESFEAGFWWEGTTEGGLFNITNFEIRSFTEGENLEEKIAHTEAWNAFIAQWNAATTNRNNVLALQADKKNYPWAQDSLQNALDRWDPYYNAVISMGWLKDDGTDAGVATTDELNDWALYQGVTEYNEEGALLTYQVVRGYQNAINYVTATNKPISDLAADIKSAIAVRDDDMNSQGDKAPFQQVIDAAQAVYDDVYANTNDARMEEDLARMTAIREELAAAVEAFKASAVLTPIIDIDFANNFEEAQKDDVDGYVIKGATGEMFFPATIVDVEKSNSTTNFEIGAGEGVLDGVLRVGQATSATAPTVTIAEGDLPTDNDVLRFNFDMWFGKLITKYAYIELRNAADEKVAGFSLSRYDGAAGFNDFNNEENTGMDVVGWCNPNIGNIANENICVDTYKSSIDLIVDYKAQSLQGGVTCNGTSNMGVAVPMPTLEDNKIVKFAVYSNYNNKDRRCWFDNMKVYKYASTAEGPIDNGIHQTSHSVAGSAAIYTLSGVRVSAPVKGLYIRNGKKFVIK